MAKQMIFCVETNKKAGTDKAYILETLRHWYDIGRDKITFVCMNTKTKYKSKDVIKEINQYIKNYKNGDSYVVYCIDTDHYEKNTYHKKQLDEIEEYCITNDYELVWFCHDIEEVYLGKSISDDQKVREVAMFKDRETIGEIPESRLNRNEKNRCVSNILNVVDKYLRRK